jgi:hypothetical protein
VTTSNQASRTSIVPVTSAAMITNLSAPPGSPGSCCRGAEQRHVESHPSQCPMIYDVAAGERQTKDHDPRDQTETGCHQEVDYSSPTLPRRICVSEDTLVEYSEPMRKARLVRHLSSRRFLYRSTCPLHRQPDSG